MTEQKKKRSMELLERSRSAKKKPHSKALERKLGKGKNNAKFDKVNFSG